MTNLDSILKGRDITFNKGPSSESYGFSMYGWMWELDYKESWMLKNWCFWTVVLEKTLESPLDSKEIQPVYPKGNQSWIFIGKTDAEVKLHHFGDLMRRTDSLEKTDAGKDWGQEEKHPSCWNSCSRCGGERVVLTPTESKREGESPPEALWFHSNCGYHPKPETKRQVIQKVTCFNWYLKYTKLV